VIAQAEMARILTEMGPVTDDLNEDNNDDDQPKARPEGAAGASSSSSSSYSSSSSSSSSDHRAGASSGGARRLYRLPDGAMIAGVANGIGAYFKIDVAIIRLLFIALAILTHGWAIIGYIVLMFVIPSAHTPEQWAAAHGAPFNAQEIIDRAKREYNDFATQTGGPPWSRSARRAARRARRTMRRAARSAARGARYSYDWSTYTQPVYGPMQGGRIHPVTGAIAGLIALIFGLVGAALTIAFIVALVSLLATGAILGLAPPANLPIWAAIIILIVVFSIVSSPLRAIQRGAYSAMTGRNFYAYAAVDGIVWLGLLGLGVWLTYLYVPSAHAWLEQGRVWAQQAWASMIASLPK
jgi:phage shock protein PspC (stress-responsive transcriptional regulator)